MYKSCYNDLYMIDLQLIDYSTVACPGIFHEGEGGKHVIKED